jgi:hypothetical protein
MKKLAIRVGVILAIAVACSLFFSNTIVTITTPKVKFAQVGYKRFEEQIALEGALYFANTDKYTIDEARKTPVTVEKMFVRLGDLVAKGDTICTTRLSDSFAEEVATASEALLTARQAFSDNETANIALINTFDSDKNEAKRLMDDTAKALVDAQSKLLAEAAKAGILLDDDPKKWADEVQRTGKPDLVALMDDVMDAQSAADAASTAFLDTYANSKTKKEVYEFLNKRADLQKAVEKEDKKLRELIASGESITTIRAEHDGYIVALGVQEGAVYDGGQPAYELTVAGEQPVLRCDISGYTKRDFTQGMRAEIRTEQETLKAEVTAIVREGVDKKHLHIDLSDENISRLGGVRALLTAATTVRVTYRAKESTAILPVAAIRKDGENYFIYVTDYQSDGLWGDYMVARKLPVTVLELGDKEAAVQEDLRYGSAPIYQEDRALKDGGRVMEYVE